MGIRDWLAIIVIIFIVLILLDGFRRKWLERKNRIVVKINKNVPSGNGGNVTDPLTKSELPNGGVRTISRSDGTLVDEYDEPVDDVPVLMESVDINENEIEEYASGTIEDQAWDAIEDSPRDSIDEDLIEEKDELEELVDLETQEDRENWKEQEDIHSKENLLGGQETEGERIEPIFGDQELTFSRDNQGELDLDHLNLFESEHDANDERSDENNIVQEVIIINVMAKMGTLIKGKQLLPVLLKNSMQLGEMNIFHRHADADGKGPVMFSMANMVKPGTFTMGEMEDFTTPGVSIFMQLPKKLGNMQCFEQMLKTAEALKEDLDVLLKDENRSVFTLQTIEHSRQRIRDFELEMLARK